jgi:hypothetical protein
MADYDTCGIRTPDQAVKADWQRPNVSAPSDPRGGFGSDPEFQIMGSIDNGGTWSRHEGVTRNRFVN